MRFAKASVVLLMFALLLVDSSFGQVTVRPEYTISGRLLYEGGELSCEHCVISLLMTGIRPFAVTYADLAGRFTFRNVPRGSYTIHIQLEGFEEINQEVPVSDAFVSGVLTTVMLHRKPVVIQSGGRNVIDVSEFMERYPKKAVDAFKKGIDSKKKDKGKEALKHFENAVKAAPDFYEAHNELGLAYKQAGRSGDAEREFVRAQELNPSSADPLVNLTSLYIDEGKPDEAVKTGEEAVKKNSRSAPAFFNLGMALYRVAMLDRAEAALKKALALAPKMGNVRLMLANVYLKLRKRDKLIEQLDFYLVENPRGDQRQAVLEMRDKVLNATPE